MKPFWHVRFDVEYIGSFKMRQTKALQMPNNRYDVWCTGSKWYVCFGVKASEYSSRDSLTQLVDLVRVRLCYSHALKMILNNKGL